MSVFECEAFDNHEKVVFCSDPDTGLRAIIAVHSTALGPAGGGCRMWNYASEADAIRDVLRLSRGMSYKASVAGINLGGGKSVIIGDSRTEKTPELMRAFGRAVDQLAGRYITAEDVGMTVADMEIVAQETKFVTGLDIGDTPSGDPSPVTAHGVFSGLLAAVRHALGRDDLEGIRVAVQGLGHVGYNLCAELKDAGAELIVADIVAENVSRVVDEFGATAVGADEIISQDADVYSPCALGATLNDQTIPTLRCKVIAGAANNQLAEARHGPAVRERGILYAPDYVINAGGIMNCANEVEGISLDKAAQFVAVERIGETLTGIFQQADREDRTPEAVSDAIAEVRIAAAKATKAAKSESRAA